MVNLERVFQLSDPSGKYQNIRIGVEAETSEEAVQEIYRTLFLERIFYYTITDNEDNLAESIQMLERVLEYGKLQHPDQAEDA